MNHGTSVSAVSSNSSSSSSINTTTNSTVNTVSNSGSSGVSGGNGNGSIQSGSLVASAVSSSSSFVLKGIPIATDEVKKSGWIKMKNSMKIWVNRWFVLRAGRVYFYKDDKSFGKKRASGVLLLAHCQVAEHATKQKRDGSFFQIVNQMHHSVYERSRLLKVTTHMVPTGSWRVILRVPTNEERASWISALQEQIQFANSLSENATSLTPDALSPSNSTYSSEIEPEQELEEEGGEDSAVQFTAELSKNLLKNNEIFYKTNLVNGIRIQQKRISKTLQKLLFENLELWKVDITKRLFTLEREITISFEKRKQQEQEETTSPISLRYWQLLAVIFLCFLLGRLWKTLYISGYSYAYY